jgi:hypothetical protein
VSNPLSSAKVIRLRGEARTDPPAQGPLRVELAEIEEGGVLHVRLPDGTQFACDWLESFADVEPLRVGDRLLALPPAEGQPGIVLGRIGRYRPPVQGAVAREVVIAASESLSLQCGEARVDLRADGKMMIRGEDVLIRARGTQRIKAGTVNIN